MLYSPSYSAATADAHRNGDDGTFFEQAVDLARQGNHDQAIHMLHQAVEAGECSSPEALVLKGKILVRQGRHLEAEAAWLQALKLDPTSTAARAALERLRRERLPAWRIGRTMRIAGFLVLVGLIIWCAVVELQRIREARLDAAAQTKSLAASNLTLERSIQSQAEASEHQLAELRVSLAGAQTEMTALAEKLRIQHQQDRDLVLAEIKRNATSVATQTAEQLSKTQAALVAELHDSTAGTRAAVSSLAETLDVQRQQDLRQLISALKENGDTIASQSERLSQAEAQTKLNLNSLAVRQAQGTSELRARIERDAEVSARTAAETQAALALLEQRLDQSVSRLDDGIDSTHDAIDRIWWFHVARKTKPVSAPATHAATASPHHGAATQPVAAPGQSSAGKVTSAENAEGSK